MGARASRLEGSRLLVFNVVTSGLAYGAGDLIQQRMEARRKGTEVKMDLRRSSRMLAVGAPIGGMSHYWYILLDRVVSGATAGAVVRKVLADMCIFAPICLTTFFVGEPHHTLFVCHVMWPCAQGLGLWRERKAERLHWT